MFLAFTEASLFATMYSRAWLVPTLLSFSLMLAAQADRRARSRELLENDYVRVSSLEFLAGSHAPAENLWDLVWIALDDTNLTLLPMEGDRQEINFRAGDVRFFRSFRIREFQNDSDEPFRGIVVELKQRNLTADACFCFGQIERSVCGCGAPSHLPSLWAVGIGSITLAGTTLTADQSFTGARNRDDSLLVALTQLQLRDLADGGSSGLQLNPGEVSWIKAGRHQFRNVGQNTARFVTIEF